MPLNVLVIGQFALLYNLLTKSEMGRVLVFANRRDGTQRVADRLQDQGIKCELWSGSVPQKKRMRLLDDFRAGKVKVVVATDVAGRGIHVDGVTHVINYDFPYESENYVHRIGRTGRAGEKGTAISFACEDESFIIPEIEEYIGRSLPCKQPEEDLLVEPPKVERRRPRRSSHSGESGQRRRTGDRGGNRGRDTRRRR